MSDMTDRPEQERRDLAYQHRGDIVDDSAEPIEPRRLNQVVTVRFDPDLLRSLRQVAESRDLSVSEAIREAASQWIVREAESREPYVGSIRVHFASQVFDYVVRPGESSSGAWSSDAAIETHAPR